MGVLLIGTMWLCWCDFSLILCEHTHEQIIHKHAMTHSTGSSTLVPYIVTVTIICVAAEKISAPVSRCDSCCETTTPEITRCSCYDWFIKQEFVWSEAPLSWLSSESWVTINGCWSIPVRANFLLLACLHNLIDSRQDIELRSCRLRWWVQERSRALHHIWDSHKVSEYLDWIAVDVDSAEVINLMSIRVTNISTAECV